MKIKHLFCMALAGIIFAGSLGNGYVLAENTAEYYAENFDNFSGVTLPQGMTLAAPNNEKITAIPYSTDGGRAALVSLAQNAADNNNAPALRITPEPYLSAQRLTVSFDLNIMSYTANADSPVFAVSMRSSVGWFMSYNDLAFWNGSVQERWSSENAASYEKNKWYTVCLLYTSKGSGKSS